MKNIVVWLDGWFSSAFNIIEMIKKNPDKRPIKVIGTHNKEMGYKILCDEFFIRENFERNNNSIEYLKWATDFCKKHKIDIFIPRYFQSEIAKSATSFTYLGVTPMIDMCTPLLDSKWETYKLIQNDYPEIVPTIRKVKGILDVYNFFLSDEINQSPFLLKPDIGTGAKGLKYFWRVQDILALETNKDTYMSEKDYFAMPFLEGAEYSIDCVCTNDNEWVIVPRKKVHNTRIQEITDNKEIIEIAKRILKFLGISSIPVNIQLKEHNGKPYLLEINPRWSGGLHLACLNGINLPYLSIKRLLNEPIPKQPPIKECRVCNVERGVII